MTKRKSRGSSAKRKSRGGSAKGKSRSLGRKRKRKFWALLINYLGSYSRSKDMAIEKIVGKSSNGSGFGLGMRDLSFYYDKKSTAKNAYAKIRKKEPYMSAKIQMFES